MVHLVRHVYHHRFSLKELKNNQLQELYLAMMLKTLGLSLIGVFIPIYLYELGYAIDTIVLFFAFVFGIRILTDNVAAWLTGYYGPKHMMILSHIFLVLNLALLLTLDSQNWPLLLIGVTHALASGFFFIAYHIEFSKLSSAKHAGSQIGTMYKVAKFASAVGPLLGGVIATVFNVPVAIIIALALIMASALPLSLSPEPVRRKQHITWKGFPWKEAKWDLISNAGLGFDQMTYVVVWPLYISLFFFADNVYLGVGLVTSLGLAVAVITASLFGRVIDNGHGGMLMKCGVVLASISNFLRPVIPSATTVVIFNLVNDSLNSSVRMPYTKGMYQAASSHEGYRDAYVGAIMTSSNIMRAGIFLTLFALLQFHSTKASFQISFLIAGLLLQLVLLHRYKSLKS